MSNLTKVDMYGDDYYICKKTRAGYDKVLKKIDPLISSYCKKISIPGYSFEDIKQELSQIAIEGIDSYDVSKKVKLSTFLHIHIKNKFISFAKHHNKLSKNASINSPKMGTNGFRKIKKELVFSSIQLSESDNQTLSDTVDQHYSEADAIFASDGYASSDMDVTAIFKIIEKFTDEKILDILKKISIYGLSLEEACAENGIKSWVASAKIKKLSEIPEIKEVMKSLL